MDKLEMWQLKQRQGQPLEIKERLSEERIRVWYDHWEGQVYVSFSGGKDSTVLLHLVRRLYPDVPAVFVDTGLEYPEIREFVKTIENVVWLKPKMPFTEVVKKYGYPVISKETARKLKDVQNPTPNNVRTRNIRMGVIPSKVGVISKKWRYLKDAPFKIGDGCCDALKKRPFHQYEKETGLKPFIGIMAEESRYRQQAYLRNSCNAFNLKRPMSTPLAAWVEKDIWAYIKKFNVPYSKIYDMGYDRTGCMFCMFGVHLEKDENRFQKMAKTHPKQYDYCINKLGLGEVLDFIDTPYGDYEEPAEQLDLLEKEASND